MNSVLCMGFDCRLCVAPSGLPPRCCRCSCDVCPRRQQAAAGRLQLIPAFSFRWWLQALPPRCLQSAAAAPPLRRAPALPATVTATHRCRRTTRASTTRWQLTLTCPRCRPRCTPTRALPPGRRCAGRGPIAATRRVVFTLQIRLGISSQPLWHLQIPSPCPLALRSLVRRCAM